ncbi:MAG TPA: CHAP domain-containing protein [Candidatus Saccharimonadales bacterium]|nr:CHAP domain-containing protein [Candidatus Saccharimonadales bacterium]
MKKIAIIGKLYKKVSLFLAALVVAVGCIPSLPAAAETGGYPDWNATDCSGTYGIYSWCKGGTWLSSRGYGYRNCVDYAAWKVASLGVTSAQYGGLNNAKYWNDNAASHGLVANTTPAVGAIAVDESGTFGHIAFVESVGGNNIISVSEYNKQGNGNYDTRTGTPAALLFIVCPLRSIRTDIPVIHG